MKFESFSNRKSNEEIEKQVSKTSDTLGADIIHESMKDDLSLLGINQLKEKYKVRYDAYLAMFRAEKQGRELESKDFNKARIYITAFNNLDEYIQKQDSGENKVLRGRQIPVLNDIRDAFEKGITRGYIKLPTGVGKTVLFSQLLEALKMRAFIGVPSLPLVKQTSDKLETFTNRSYGVYTGKEKDLTKEITTITYQSLINAVRNGDVNPDNVPIFIADEAHKILGPETLNAMDSFEGIILGFTATPDYSDNKKLSDFLSEEIHSMNISEAIEGGLACQTKTIHAHTNVDLSNVPIVNGDYDSKSLEKVINVHGRNMAAMELYKNKFSHLKAIVNCSGVNHAKDVANLFQENGIKAECVHGGMKDEEVDMILKKLENGEIQVVTNAKLLIEGFDEPSLSVALNLQPTLSPVVAEQRGGRALRLDDNNIDKWGYVIDFIDKNSNKNPILFSEILGGDRVIPEGSNNDEKEKDGDMVIPEGSNNDKKEEDVEKGGNIKNLINFDDLNIDGLRVVVDTQEILEVTRKYIESRENWTYETLRNDILDKSIKSSSDYKKKSSENGWPTIATLSSMPEFPRNQDGTNDWNTFLEKMTFRDIQNSVREQGIKSSSDYQKKSPENGWPAIATLSNMPEFPRNQDGTNDWNTFLDTGKENKNWTYETLRNDILNKSIKSSSDYQKKSPENGWPASTTLSSMPEFPKNPDGSNDWNTFLDKDKK